MSHNQNEGREKNEGEEEPIKLLRSGHNSTMKDPPRIPLTRAWKQTCAKSVTTASMPWKL